jgi:ribosomal protein L40E
MSFGVDALGALTEKLRQLVNDTQEKYETFLDDTQLFKQGKINEKEFFAKIGEYLITFSALNFLAIRVILELKSAADKGTSLKSSTGGTAYTSSSTQSGFGVGGFVGTGGTVGSGSGSQEYSLPTPQETEYQEPRLRPAGIDVKILDKPDAESSKQSTKNCIACGSAIPSQAKFCNKCGNSQ